MYVLAMNTGAFLTSTNQIDSVESARLKISYLELEQHRISGLVFSTVVELVFSLKSPLPGKESCMELLESTVALLEAPGASPRCFFTFAGACCL